MAVEDDILFFEQAPMLQLLGRTALRILALGVRSHDVPHGNVLFGKGDIADGGYLIRNGSFVIGESNFSGQIAGPGELLGEMSMITEGVRGTTATAREDSMVVSIPRSLFLRTLDSYPDAATRLRDHIAAHAEQSVRDLSKLRAILTRADQR